MSAVPPHSVGAIDPHWWHSIRAMQRATKIVAQAFSDLNPAHQQGYTQKAKAYSQKLDDLYRWTKKQVNTVPRSQRYLATAHAAFGYFCKEFGFKAVPIQGLTKERNPTPHYLAETIEVIHAKNIRAVFPETARTRRF